MAKQGLSLQSTHGMGITRREAAEVDSTSFILWWGRTISSTSDLKIRVDLIGGGGTLAEADEKDTPYPAP